MCVCLLGFFSCFHIISGHIIKSERDGVTKHVILPPCLQHVEIELESSFFPHLHVFDSLKFIGKQKTLIAIVVQFTYMLNRQGHCSVPFASCSFTE